MKKNVAILLFDDVEVLDFAGPFEVFAVTSELRGNDTFNVFTVADSPATVRARHGLKIVPNYTTDACPTPHLLIVPGGVGTRALLNKIGLLEWIRTRARAAELTMSVCTGALVLAKAGLLDGLRATTHHTAFAQLRELAPRTEVVETERFVDNGSILTAAGISAGIDCALHVVERLLGADIAAFVTLGVSRRAVSSSRPPISSSSNATAPRCSTMRRRSPRGTSRSSSARAPAPRAAGPICIL